MTEAQILDQDRLSKIDKYVEVYRGFYDDAPHWPEEVKLVRVDEEYYKKNIANSKTPWILAFLRSVKSQEHLVHSEEFFQTL